MKVGCETVPDGVPETDTLPAVPVKVGCVKAFTLVATVVFAPFVGSAPAENAMVKISFSTVAVNEGSVPTAVIEFTVVVFSVTAPPVFDPEGVNVPVEVIDDPVKVGCETVPDGV